jgi:hypothetical protein
MRGLSGIGARCRRGIGRNCYQPWEKNPVITAAAALSIAVPTAAMAQSIWTTGTASNRAAVGYQTPNN